MSFKSSAAEECEKGLTEVVHPTCWGRALAAFGTLLLGACVNSHEVRPYKTLPGSMHATVISAGGAARRPGGGEAQPGDNFTGIQVKQGVRYLFQAEPSADFADAGLKLKNLDGWDSLLLRPLRRHKRMPNEAFFTLIGTINGKLPFRIQEGMSWEAPASGELVCYLNDWPSKYGNNHGSLLLQVSPCPAACSPAVVMTTKDAAKE